MRRNPTQRSGPNTICLAVGMLLFTVGAFAADPETLTVKTLDSRSDFDSDQHRFFESRIRPLLVERCYECHSADNTEGGLRLDQSNSLTIGGDSGSPIVPGDADSSLLMAAVRYDDLEMPPDEPLSDAAIKDLQAWIDGGAFWPKRFDADGDIDMIDQEPAQAWWASDPIEVVPPKVTSDDMFQGEAAPPEPATTIDRYVDASLDEAGLSRSPRANKAKLLRRLSYDLLGVPPDREQVEAFLADDDPSAYNRIVDQMLASPMYGERFGRHWLDLVRFAESDGYRQDAFRPTAYKYRDWVIDALNAGMPYDQFVKFQLAGDEVAPGDPDALAASGFLRLGIYEYNQRDAEGQWQVIVDEMTDVTADVFMATGLACAKCHDHKFDPIPRGDYFKFRSVFEPITFYDVPPVRPDVTAVDLSEREIDAMLKELNSIEGMAVSNLGRKAADLFPVNVQAMYDKPADERNSYEEQIANLVHLQVLERQNRDKDVEKAIGKKLSERRKQILTRLRQAGREPRPRPSLMAVADARGPTRPTRLPGRSTGRDFKPTVPEVFGGQPLPYEPPIDNPTSTGRRLALANWMTSPGNPITPRVIVNRLWQYHFGNGLVETPNDFGALGTLPSHPEMLDYLAARLVDSGWDLKRIQREMVLSETYQQSARHPDQAACLTIDPRNRLHWHRSVRRLDAEQYRDTLLFAMDRIDHEIGGPSPKDAPPRRTVYLRRHRNTSDEMLRLMDAPTGIVGTAQRDVTITPTQTLLMMNNARLVSVAGKFAERVHADLVACGAIDESTTWLNPGQAKRFVRDAYRLLTADELEDSMVDQLAVVASEGTRGQRDVCHVLLNSNALLFIE